jgi:polyisoprenoid-binding protein YceI
MAPLAAALVLGGCEDGKEPSEPNPVQAAPKAATPSQKSGTKGSNEAEGNEGEARTGTGEQTAAAIPEKAYGKYKIDPGHSAVLFQSKHFGFSKLYGLFNDVTGTVVLKEDPSKSSVDLEVAAKSLFSGHKKRDKDLKGPDFLNVKQFPKMTFESTSVKKTSDGFLVEGKLSLHGKTKPVEVTMEHVGSGKFPMDGSYRTGFHGSFTIKRSEFGMDYMMEGIPDEVTLKPSIEAIKQS